MKAATAVKILFLLGGASLAEILWKKADAAVYVNSPFRARRSIYYSQQQAPIFEQEKRTADLPRSKNVQRRQTRVDPPSAIRTDIATVYKKSIHTLWSFFIHKHSTECLLLLSTEYVKGPADAVVIQEAARSTLNLGKES